jgi:4'-phosphopantetheinyl transferase
MGVTVDVCWTTLDERGDLAALARTLSPDECQRAVRFTFAWDRLRFVASRAILRALLADRLGSAPADIRLTCNEFGKPRLASGTLRFNVSHAGNVTLFVFADGVEVGCDIEWRDDRLRVEGIAGGFFAPAEREAIRRLPPNSRAEGFFNAWTRKEAFVKGLGVGLSLPLDQVEVSLAPGEPAVFRRGAAGWSLHAFEPSPGLHAAVATGEPASFRMAPFAGRRRPLPPWPWQTGWRLHPGVRDHARSEAATSSAQH